MTLTFPLHEFVVDLHEHDLAYLMTVLSAKEIIGVDNKRLARCLGDRDELMAGQNALAVIDDEGGADIDTRLLLLCAVAAAPMATIRATNGSRAVTYHMDEGQVVEVLQTEPDRYRLTGLATVRSVVERLTGFGDASVGWTVSCDIAVGLDSHVVTELETPLEETEQIESMVAEAFAAAQPADDWHGPDDRR